MLVTNTFTQNTSIVSCSVDPSVSPRIHSEASLANVRRSLPTPRAQRIRLLRRTLLQQLLYNLNILVRAKRRVQLLLRCLPEDPLRSLIREEDLE